MADEVLTSRDGAVLTITFNRPEVYNAFNRPLHEALRLQEAMMGLLPGYATPRIVCDVPYVGKRWVHQYTEYDRERGISYWDGRFAYYDPISSLAPTGQRWWESQHP